MKEAFSWTDRPFDKAPDLTLNSDSFSLGYGNAVDQTISFPEYGEPLISPAYGEPVVKSSASPGYGEPVVKSSASPGYGEPVIKSSASPGYGEPVVKSSASPGYGEPVIKSSASPGYGEPVVKSNSSPKYGEPEINSNSSPGYGEPVVKSNSSPGLEEPVVKSNSSPGYGEPVVKSNSFPEYGEPVDKSPGIVDGEVQSNLSGKNSSLNPSEDDSHHSSELPLVETKVSIGEATFKNVKKSEKSPKVIKPKNIVYITTEDPNLSRTESNKENSAAGKQSEPINKVNPEKFKFKNNPSEKIKFGTRLTEENTVIADPKPAENPGKLLIAEKLTRHPAPILKTSGTLTPILKTPGSLAPISKTELFLTPDPDYVYEVWKIVLCFFWLKYNNFWTT